MKWPRLMLVLVALVVSWSCGGSPLPSTAPSSATVLSVAVNGSPTDFTDVGQTVQLTATATFSDGATQNVTGTATWQALSGAGTVTSGGLVTAVTSGAVTIRATYQGKSGLAAFRISPTTPSRGSMSATIDGASWVASYVWVTTFSSGRLSVTGVNSFTGRYVEVVVTVPAVVGTYSSDDLDAGVWIPAAGPNQEGVKGTVTIDTLTATGATGTFFFTGTVAPFTEVTNGVFNITF